jgi:fatty-acyl-CoA synthase
MANTPYDTDLDRNSANFQPLTPIGFLERAASVFPDHTAIIHGPLRRNYAELYARTRRLVRRWPRAASGAAIRCR